jgi:pSer/pThr/pTyr-binding forkhead associated (FHA) protein
MQVKLVVAKGSNHKQTIQLKSSETVIGRRRGCDVRISSSQVSRRHCLLSLHAGSVVVQDLDSVNGTFINGQRVLGKRMVRPGDRLDVGPISFVVDYAPGSPGAAMEQAVQSPGAELEVLPAVEEGASPFAFNNDEEPLDELELVEEDTEHVAEQVQRRQPARQQPVEEIAEVLPVDEDEEEGPLRPDGEVQNLFSEMNQPRPGKRPGRSS